ncbi:MAG: recombinase family protein [Methylococcaceae bacterium]
MPDHPAPADASPASAPPLRQRAAQYVRMSTDHQKYSTENQADKIRAYAEQRGLEIAAPMPTRARAGCRSMAGRRCNG